jgi:two-component system, cell cycle sensor histidine kinase and response regulator CckA
VKQILVVDNDRFILELLKDILTQKGHRVLTAEDGLSALDVLETFTPDVIFVDMVMPNIDGKRLCRILRKMEDLKRTVIVSLSATAMEDLSGIEALGVNAVIAKGPIPEMSKEILQMVEKPCSEQGFPLQGGKTTGSETMRRRGITRELLSGMKHLEVILESMNEGIFELSPDQRIVYVNRSASLLTDLPEEDMLGRPFLTLFEGEYRKRAGELFEGGHKRTAQGFQDPPLMLSGYQVTMDVRPIPGTDGKTIVILEDVTEKRFLESQFQHAQRMASIGTLAGGIAHEFNNLLMVIQANTSLVMYEKDPKTPDYQRLKGIEAVVQKGADLTRHLLAFARDGGHHPEPTDINGLMKQTEDLFARTKKEIVLHADYQEDIPPVEVDPMQIEQVLMSLFINAWEAMPDGGELFVETRTVQLKGGLSSSCTMGPGNYIRISIRDTGMGMDAQT